MAGTIRLIAGLLCLLAVTLSYGQKTLIKVIDQNTKEPVAFCHVCLEGLKTGTPKYCLTTAEGQAEIDFREPSKIVISYVGYRTYTDTVQPGEKLTIELKPSVTNMEEVVVTAQYSPERADKSIYRVKVITSRQIEQKAAINLADLMKDMPAMRVGQDAIFGTTLKIQGLSGENVKILMDGVPVIGRMNGNIDLTQINLNNVDHVEVIEGPMSVIYGSNALAGVINLITKENKNSFLNTTANFYYETVGNYNVDGSVTINRKKHGFSLDGGRNFFDGFSIYDSARSQMFNPKRQYFFDSYYSFTANKFKIKISGAYFDEKLVDNGSLQPLYYETAFDNEFITRRYSAGLDGAWQVSRYHSLTALWAISEYNRIRQTYFNDLTTLTKSPVEQPWARDTNEIQSITARAAYSINKQEAMINFQTGLDMLHETGTGEKIEGTRQEIGDYALFASIKLEPWRKKRKSEPDKPGDAIVSFQPGIRFIYNSRYQAPVVYAISIKGNLMEAMQLRLTYSTGFRAPSLKELYLDFVDINHNVQGNPDLKAENSNNINLNFNYSPESKKNSWNVETTLYFNDIRNVILLAQTEPNTTEYTYKNVSKYRTTGIQASGSLTIYPSLSITTGFSVTGITGSPYDSVAFAPFQWSPEVTTNASWNFIRQDLLLALYYKFTGQTQQLGFSGEDMDWYTISSYNTMDITATKGFWNGRIRLSAGVKNLFDVTTIPTTGNAFSGGHSGNAGGNANIGWGRSFFAKISFQFNQYK
jgi:outer membrane receptor for ferrienterochelin and colicins